MRAFDAKPIPICRQSSEARMLICLTMPFIWATSKLCSINSAESDTRCASVCVGAWFWCCLHIRRLDTLCSKFASRMEFNILWQRTRSRRTHWTIHTSNAAFVNRWLRKCYYYWVDARLRRKRIYSRRTDSYDFSNLLWAERTASMVYTRKHAHVQSTRIPAHSINIKAPSSWVWYVSIVAAITSLFTFAVLDAYLLYIVDWLKSSA